MKSPKVRLYVRVRLSNGRNSYNDPVWNRNGSLRAGYALIDDQPQHHPEAIYYLRFLRGSKRVWQAVGQEADAALSALHRTEHQLKSITLGLLPVAASDERPNGRSIPSSGISLEEAITS